MIRISDYSPLKIIPKKGKEQPRELSLREEPCAGCHKELMCVGQFPEGRPTKKPSTHHQFPVINMQWSYGARVLLKRGPSGRAPTTVAAIPKDQPSHFFPQEAAIPKN